MERTFEIYRFDPENDEASRFETYKVEVEPTERILDCLNKIRWDLDPSLAYRMSCAHGVCGSDGMRINGVCALACQGLVRDYGEDPIRIEPLPNFKVVKDLIVEMDPFFEKYRAVSPYLQPSDEAGEKERIQSAEERAVFDEAIRCILCACCTASCPVTPDKSDFLGPAALLRSFRYLFDSRDGAAEERMAFLDRDDGIQGCKGHGKCTDVCPKEIDVRKSLGKVKKRIYDHKKAQG